MIRTEDLGVHYGSLTAVRSASLHVAKGSTLAIVGPSGCGKSSFLAALNRMTDLTPGARISGRVLIDCCDIHGSCLSPTELRLCVGMIFQRPNPFPMSIRRNIQLALREHGRRSRAELEEITEGVLEAVGLWDEVKDRLEAPAQRLSGGQQQRLCIARALALEPQILLMDEPCSALDPIASARVEELIEELKGRYTIVIVTHNLPQARRLADEVAVFWVRDGAGEIIEQGPAAAVFEDASDPTAAAYLSGIQG
ncbi:MAG: phosphate ABC transporter ATP-binding protein [Acidobacteriota bacterium]